MISGSSGHMGQGLLTGLVQDQCSFDLQRRTRENKLFSFSFEKQKQKIKQHLPDAENQSLLKAKD